MNLRDGSCDVLQQVDAMAANVHQRTTTTLFGYHSPVSIIRLVHGKRIAGHCTHGQERTDGTLSHQVKHPLDHWVETAVVCHAQLDTLFLAHLNHGVTFLDRHRHGLFHKYVLADAGTRDCLGMMEVYGSRDVEGIEIAGSDKLAGIDCPQGDIKIGAELVERLLVAATDGNQFAARICLNSCGNTATCNVTTTDDSPSN